MSFDCLADMINEELAREDRFMRIRERQRLAHLGDPQYYDEWEDDSDDG